MNEIISKLYNKSYCMAVDEADDKNFIQHHMNFFAELIVRECASICDQQGRVGWNDDRKAQARLDRDLIKEHFGVE